VNDSFVGIRDAEFYNPGSEIWTNTDSMATERCAFTLTLLPNGKVLASGGFGTSGAVATTELYDPTAGTWTPTGSLHEPRGSHTATLLLSGKVLVAGGTDFFGGGSDPTLSSAEIYDPATGTWTMTGSMGQPREVHTATLLTSGKVLIAGGVSYFGGIFPTDSELFDPNTGKWLPTLPLISGRRDHFTTLLPNGDVLITGGFNSSDTGPSAELYNPSSIAPTPVLLTHLKKLDTGAFQFEFRNTPGLIFSVLSAADLAIPLSDWPTLGSAAENTPGHYHFTDPQAAQDSQRFYRVRSPN
jgi:hypothetical protein